MEYSCLGRMHSKQKTKTKSKQTQIQNTEGQAFWCLPSCPVPIKGTQKVFANVCPSDMTQNTDL